MKVGEGEWVIILYMFLFSPKYPFYVMSVHLCLIITGTRQKYFPKLDYSKIEKRLINELFVFFL